MYYTLQISLSQYYVFNNIFENIWEENWMQSASFDIGISCSSKCEMAYGNVHRMPYTTKTYK